MYKRGRPNCWPINTQVEHLVIRCEELVFLLPKTKELQHAVPFKTHVCSLQQQDRKWLTESTSGNSTRESTQESERGEKR